MEYSKSEAQRRFLRNRAIKAKEEETCCDCTGCESCTGFVRNCNCDTDLSFLPWRKQSKDAPSEGT